MAPRSEDIAQNSNSDNGDAVTERGDNVDKNKHGEDELNGFLQRLSKRVARRPCLYLGVNMVVAIALSAVGLIAGKFSISTNTGGWQSRGTLIANRQTQLMLTRFNKDELFYGGDEVWEDLTSNVQPGWEDDDSVGRRLSTPAMNTAAIDAAEPFADYLRPSADRIELGESIIAAQNQDHGMDHHHDRKFPFELTPDLRRKLQLNIATSGCDFGWYLSDELMWGTHLWPLWKITASSSSVTDPNVLRDICEAEANTQSLLESKGLCFGCEVGCLPPYSIVLYARLEVENGFSLSCEELAGAWTSKQATVEGQWSTCVADIKANQDATVEALPPSCPPNFSPTLVDEMTDVNNGKSLYTSSIFATRDADVDEMYLEADNMDQGKGSDVVKGAYDTQYESFGQVYVDASITNDMALAVGSAGVVAIAIVIHTRSPFITLIGLLQIILSFPLSYFVYKLVAGLDFFPFLNFIGIFVVFALGAGDVFVAVDKFKNARLVHPHASTEHVAAVALPDAALAMFLTTVTTALAFFATAICPVAPIKMFAIFCGLLILFDYIMNILLVFPALCIYDRAIKAKEHKGANCCITIACCGGQAAEDQVGIQASDIDVEVTSDILKENEVKLSLIRRILTAFYEILHRLRWPLAVVCLAGFAVSVYFATTLKLPTSGDVRLLSDKNQFEQNFLWRQKLMSSTLQKSGGSRAYMIWGVSPADSGNKNDPNSWSKLVLDDSFAPSAEQAQVDLVTFCEDMFEQEFAIAPREDYICPIQKFDLWLQEQAASASPDAIYTSLCGGATKIPVPQADFDPCMIAWTRSVDETSILSRNGRVAIMFFPFTSRTRFDSPFNESKEEWNMIEDWVQEQNENSTMNGYFSSFDFWWFDTNGQMLQTAYSAAGIALGCAAIVILFSSRSLILTFFSVMTIAYVLTSVTATLVGLGWTLGFLESICFAILIGVSVDFVIHLSHAYSTLPGDVERGKRTKYALINMGPSILATAATTILSAVVMLFTVITFFQKFALILFFTVIQATVGSFVVFLTMVECVGPSNPTYLADKVTGCFRKEKA